MGMWLLGLVFLVNIYRGLVTSVLIAEPSEDPINSASKLWKHTEIKKLVSSNSATSAEVNIPEGVKFYPGLTEKCIREASNGKSVCIDFEMNTLIMLSGMNQTQHFCMGNILNSVPIGLLLQKYSPHRKSI